MPDSTPDVVVVSTTSQAAELAALLHSPHRSRPVAVVTRPAGMDASHIDAAELWDQVGDVVDVYVMGTGAVSFAFSHRMPDRTQVYGGAGRVYPVGHAWVDQPHRSPLRFAFTAREGVAATRHLVEDALTMASTAGLIGLSVPSARPTIASGEVKGLAAGSAVVRLDTGGFASVAEGLLLPGVPLERVLRPGMRVSGTVDTSGRLDLRASLQEAASCLAHLSEDDPVLARVDSVEPDGAVLALHPELVVALSRQDVTPNELDDLTTLFSEGEIVVAHVHTTGPRWQLRMWDVDDNEVPLAAPALLEGGPPWLVPAVVTFPVLDRTRSASRPRFLPPRRRRTTPRPTAATRSPSRCRPTSKRRRASTSRPLP